MVKHLISMAMLLCTFAAYAGVNPQTLKETVSSRLGVPVYLVDRTPIPGFYMVGTSQGVLYSDANGDYLVQGVMLDMTRDMKNLTLSGLRHQRRMALAQIGEPPMLLRATKETHRITLFTDDACTDCRRALDQLPRLQELGVTVQLLPIVSPAGGQERISPEQCEAGAWRHSQFSEHLPVARCSEILSHYIGLSQWLGIKALPSWVLPNGDLVRGYQSPEQLLKILDHIDAPANPSSSAS